MSNAWTLLALRAPCAARQSRSQPLLQLFNGYAKQRSAHFEAGQLFRPHGNRAYLRRPESNFTRNFSSALRRGQHKTDDTLKFGPQTLPPSKVEPAQAVAAHSDTAPLNGEGEGEDVLTWRDYDPAGGMPLPDGELDQSQIDAIFTESQVSADTGNYILSVMYWRRISGALIDAGLDFPKNSNVTRDQALAGLNYVRSLNPDFDESVAGQEWAKEETVRLEAEIQERAIKLGIYKANPEDQNAEDEVPEEDKQGTEAGRALTGSSVLQNVRMAKEAAWEQEQAEKQAAKEREELAALHSARGPLELEGGVQPQVYHLAHSYNHVGVALHAPETKVWLPPVERKAWVKYYEEQAQIIKENVVPQLSIIQRLGPSLLVLLLVLGGCYYLSENYTPPPKSARILPDTPPSVATLYALTGILAASFILGRLPPMWRFYSKYMTLVPAYPYAISLIGAGLRHDTIVHLASNLASLWLFGLFLHEDVGRGTFLAIYIGAGALGGFSSLAYNVLRSQWATYIFGSSGCVLGVVAAACTLRPNGTIQVFGYDVPIAAWVFASLFAAGELVAAVRAFKTTIDHAGHLGGMAAGAAAGWFLRQKAQPAAQQHLTISKDASS